MERRNPLRGETITAKSLSGTTYTGTFRNWSASGLWILTIGIKPDGSERIMLVLPETEVFQTFTQCEIAFNQ